MKKHFFLLTTIMLFLVSCSKNDEVPDLTPVIFVKKITFTTLTGYTYTDTYAYEGNKIINSIGSDGYKVIYTYSGDVISKKEYITSENFVTYVNDYTYSNGKLASSTEIYTNNPEISKTLYTYNVDGTVTAKTNNIDIKTNEIREGNTNIYTLNKGNLIKNNISFKTEQIIINYEFDSKNNPFENILGFNLFIGDEKACNNNISKSTSSSSSSSVTIINYSYNSNGFPIEQKVLVDNKLTLTRQYFYE